MPALDELAGLLVVVAVRGCGVLGIVLEVVELLVRHLGLIAWRAARLVSRRYGKIGVFSVRLTAFGEGREVGREGVRGRERGEEGEKLQDEHHEARGLLYEYKQHSSNDTSWRRSH